jgi:hypothetical protein
MRQLCFQPCVARFSDTGSRDGQGAVRGGRDDGGAGGVRASGQAAHLDAIQGNAARTAGDSYGDVTVKAMAMAMERVPRVVV